MDNSININCICKTTLNRSGLNNKAQTQANKKVKLNSNDQQKIFDTENFLSDDEEEGLKMDDVDFIAIASYLRNLDVDESCTENTNSAKFKICDLNCFERMRYVHSTLKNCLLASDDKKIKFDQMWASFRFLAKCPTSCDYYGTTIFHYAAADDNSELLEFLLRKISNWRQVYRFKGYLFTFKEFQIFVIVALYLYFFLVWFFETEFFKIYTYPLKLNKNN